VKESEKIKYILDKISKNMHNKKKQVVKDGYSKMRECFLKEIKKSHLDLQMERENEVVENE